MRFITALFYVEAEDIADSAGKLLKKLRDLRFDQLMASKATDRNSEPCRLGQLCFDYMRLRA